MSQVFKHIGEILARNARRFPERLGEIVAVLIELRKKYAGMAEACKLNRL